MEQHPRTVAGMNILRVADEGRFIQGIFRSKSRGKEFVCLWSAAVPGLGSLDECPAEVAPEWVRETTMSLFDRCEKKEAFRLARRFGEALVSLNGYKPNWDRMLVHHLARCVRLGLSSTEPVSKGQPCWPKVKKACLNVLALLERETPVFQKEWGEAGAAANAAAYAAAYAAYAAAYAAYAAAYAALFSSLIEDMEKEAKSLAT